MKRRLAHKAIAEAYGNGWGDAVEEIINTVEAGTTTTNAIWDTDGIHPGDIGYSLFAKAAWQGFERAVADERIGHAPSTMLHPTTYLTAKRIRLSSLSPLPDGWLIGKPHLTSLYYDFQMSRWLDDIIIGSNRLPLKGGAGKSSLPAQAGAALKAHDLAGVDYRMRELLKNPARIAAMRERALVVATPHAAQSVWKQVLSG